MGLQDKFIVLYSGNLGISHDIESILLAAKQLSKQKNIMFVIVGEGAKKEDAVRFKEKNNLENLMILPFQPEDTLPFSLGMADISIVTLEMGAEDIMILPKHFITWHLAQLVYVIKDLAQTIQKASCGNDCATRTIYEISRNSYQFIERPDSYKSLNTQHEHIVSNFMKISAHLS